MALVLELSAAGLFSAAVFEVSRRRCEDAGGQDF